MIISIRIDVFICTNIFKIQFGVTYGKDFFGYIQINTTGNFFVVLIAC
jgi:hypothetical protein